MANVMSYYDNLMTSPFTCLPVKFPVQTRPFWSVNSPAPSILDDAHRETSIDPCDVSQETQSTNALCVVKLTGDYVAFYQDLVS